MLCVNGITYNMGLAHSPSIISDGLVFYLDAANRRSYSGSGNTANGLVGGIGNTLNNGVGFGTTNSGYFIFDGANDFVDCNLDFGFDSTTSATISLWLRTNNLSQRGGILGKAGLSNWEWTLSQGIDSSDIFFWYWKVDSNVNLSISVSNFFESNVWKKVDLVWSHTLNTLTFYSNGIGITSSTPASSSFQNRASNISIAYTYNLFNNNYWAGQIGSVFLYQRALSQQEILQNYNATRKRFGL
jgi:hypothetical protein